jgi:hypothetical protein
VNIILRKISFAIIAAVFAAFLFVHHAQAEPISFSASSGNLAASVTFSLSDSILTVTLANASTADVLVPTDVLTAVFWNGTGTMMPYSAVLGSGSTVLFPPSGGEGPNVGGEWAYSDSLIGAPAAYGISSSGLDWFGAANFPGSNLQGPADSVDGLQYGITSAGDNPSTGNKKVTGSDALIKNSVVFTFTGISADFDMSKIHDVSFQYGTAAGEPNIPVPEPSLLVLLGIGMGAASLVGYRFKR